jgi:hypothetical protein
VFVTGQNVTDVAVLMEVVNQVDRVARQTEDPINAFGI